MNSEDARQLGLKEGDRVKVISQRRHSIGRMGLASRQQAIYDRESDVYSDYESGCHKLCIRVRAWATGVADATADVQPIKGETRRVAGFHANAAMWVDTALKSTRIRLVPVNL